MLRIAIVVESFPTISETFITNKVLELCKRGHQVTVFIHRKTTDNKLAELYNLKAIPNLEIVPPAIPKTSIDWVKLLIKKPAVFLHRSTSAINYKNVSRLKLLTSVFENRAFDVIHFEFSALAIVYTDVIEKLKAVTIVSCRGTAEKVKPLTMPDRKAQLKQVFSSVDSIHCVSADMAATILPCCDRPEKIFINRPSIDVSYFNRTRPYQSGTVLTILSVGRFTFQKGYLTGLLAVKKLKEAGIVFKWLIVGDGPQKEEVIFHIHTLGLENEVTLLGKKNKDEMIGLYNTADLFLLSSVYEGIANVVLEAMAMELPVVSTKSGGLNEVIEHEQDGMLAGVYDHDEIAQYLIFLANNFERRKTMGEKARQKVLNKFTIDRQINEFETTYLQLVNSKVVHSN
ncbi:MAG: glycosyltransferase family 4 protein [Chitinophagaceae bacterium]|nr:glycosyltransferase family 4 protein [Chitinophagaceae bacterium]